MNHGYPVEIIVNLGEWVKVRDQLSGLSWIEGKYLDTKRTVLVTDNTDIKEAEGADSKLLATVEKDVVLDLLSPKINNGWVKVKHQGGIVGYIQSSAIWGLY
jgi:SH3-like domain-containing protein